MASITGQGGAERAFIPQALRQQRTGHQVQICLLRPLLSRAVLAGFTGQISVRRYGVLGATEALIGLNRCIAASDVVISVSEYTPTYIAWWLARRHGKPLIAEVHSHLSAINSTFAQKQLAGLLYPRLQWVRCVSHGVGSDLVENLCVPESNIRVIYNPFDLSIIEKKSLDPIPEAHRRLFESPVVLGVGRLTRQKRFDHAMEVLSILRDTHGVRARLAILGDGELRSDLETQVATRGLTDSVDFLGFVDNPYPYLRRARALLLSSDYEGFGRVIVEAMAVGCPVVSTECPSGPSEIIEQGQSGVLVPVGDTRAMALALAKVLGDSHFSRDISSGGRRRATRFSIDRIGEEYDAFIQNVAGPS